MAGRDLAVDRARRVAEFRLGLRAFLHDSERVCRRWELTPQRYLLLLAIKGAADGSERLSFSELATSLLLSRNTVTELCARAEEAGLLRREGSLTDQRVVYLRLTAEGERRLAGVLDESDAYRRDLVHAFDALARSLRLATVVTRPERLDPGSEEPGS